MEAYPQPHTLDLWEFPGKSLYYRHKLPEKDWKLKQQIEEVLHEHPSYGHKCISIALKINRKWLHLRHSEELCVLPA